MSHQIRLNVQKLLSFALTIFVLSVLVLSVVRAQESKANSNSSITNAEQIGNQTATEYYVEKDLSDENILYKWLMAVNWLLRPSEFDSLWPLYAYSVDLIQQKCADENKGMQISERSLGHVVVATRIEKDSGRFSAYPLIVGDGENTSIIEDEAARITFGDVCRTAKDYNDTPDALFATQRPILDSDVELRLSRDLNADAGFSNSSNEGI